LTKIYLIRHAEAEGNIYRRAHGQVNGLIIGRGFAQIERLKQRFLDEKIDAVYSSDLIRAKQTANAIAEPHGLPVNTDPMLREVNMGAWEDIAWGDMEYLYPEMGRNFTVDPANWLVEGSETLARVQERMDKCIRAIAGRHEGGCVAVLSHGFSIRAFICKVMGVPSHESMRVPYCDNTAVALLHLENDEFIIEYQGDNSHLCSETSTFANQTWWRKEKDRVKENVRFDLFDPDRDSELFKQRGGDAGDLSKSSKIYTAFLINEPAGIIGYGGDDDEKYNLIRLIYIKPELRNNGFGAQLLGQVVSDLRKTKTEAIRIQARAGSETAGFCSKYGFVKIGEADMFDVFEKNIRNW